MQVEILLHLLFKDYLDGMYVELQVIVTLIQVHKVHSLKIFQVEVSSPLDFASHPTNWTMQRAETTCRGRASMCDHPWHHHCVGGLLQHLLQRRLHVILVGNLLDLIWYLLPAALGHCGEGIGRQPGGSG